MIPLAAFAIVLAFNTAVGTVLVRRFRRERGVR